MPNTALTLFNPNWGFLQIREATSVYSLATQVLQNQSRWTRRPQREFKLFSSMYSLSKPEYFPYNNRRQHHPVFNDIIKSARCFFFSDGGNQLAPHLYLNIHSYLKPAMKKKRIMQKIIFLINNYSHISNHHHTLNMPSLSSMPLY